MTKLGEFGVDTGAFIIADPAFAGEVAKASPSTGQGPLQPSSIRAPTER